MNAAEKMKQTQIHSYRAMVEFAKALGAMLLQAMFGQLYDWQDSGREGCKGMRCYRMIFVVAACCVYIAVLANLRLFRNRVREMEAKQYSALAKRLNLYDDDDDDE